MLANVDRVPFKSDYGNLFVSELGMFKSSMRLTPAS